VCAEQLLTIAEEHIVAVPFIHTKVLVETTDDGVPGHLPSHPLLQARDVLLRRARSVGESGVAGVQMGQVGDLIGAQGATAACVLGPAEPPGLEEGAIDDQLPAALEQVEQANPTLGSFKLVLLLYQHPRYPATLGGHGVTCAG